MCEPIEYGAGQSLVVQNFGPLFERANTMHLKNRSFQRRHRCLRLPSLPCLS